MKSALLRVAIGVALMLVVIWKVGTGAVWTAVTGANAAWLTAALLLVAATVVITAYRWGLLLRANGVRLPLAQLIRLYLVGLFASNFLPSSVGGDVVRLWQTGQVSGQPAAAAASVVAERITGGWALCIAAVAALPLGGEAAAYLRPAVAILVLVMALFSLLMLSPAWTGRLAAWTAQRGWTKVAAGLQEGGTALADYRTRPGTLLTVAGYAVLFQLTVAAVNICLLKGLGYSVGWLAACGLTALILAAMMVPISIGGLGVREAAYVTLFGHLGVPSDAALAASLLFLAFVTAVSLPGGLFLLAGARVRTQP